MKCFAAGIVVVYAAAGIGSVVATVKATGAETLGTGSIAEKLAVAGALASIWPAVAYIAVTQWR